MTSVSRRHAAGVAAAGSVPPGSSRASPIRSAPAAPAAASTSRSSPSMPAGSSLCTFDASGSRETGRHELVEHTDGVWHGHLPGAGAGLVYGYRVWGPVDHEKGLRFNPSKLLLDPYARRFTGDFRWTDAHLDSGEHAAEDNARDIFKSVVTARRRRHARLAAVRLAGRRAAGDTAGPVGALRSPRQGLHAAASRGAAGAARHLRRLLLAAGHRAPQAARRDGGQPAAGAPVGRASSRWCARGWPTTGATARSASSRPTAASRAQDPVAEFKTMVRELHRAGIEVILDVVYNHTAEGDHRGPTLSMRGLDNRSYYHLRRNLPGHYENYTGTGNTLNLGHPRVLQMVMDSLRYWVTEMHVDGFRFDLAATLGRYSHAEGGSDGGFDRNAAFFHAVRQDPVLVARQADRRALGCRHRRLPGRAVPAGWSEWNDRFRDAVRSFWVSKGSYRGDLARRLEGSSDLFRHAGRRPQASLNYVTAHDGFTLRGPGQLFAQAQRGERRGQPRRQLRQPQLELRHRRPDRPADGHGAARPAQARAAGVAAAVAGRADAARRRRARPHPARQQQRLQPGQRHQLVRLAVGRRRPDRIHRLADRACARSIRSCAARTGCIIAVPAAASTRRATPSGCTGSAGR